MIIKTSKMLRANDVRKMCIAQDWYTCGDCRAYESLLGMCNSTNVTTELIYKIAKDIVEHSDLSAYCQSDTENIESVMFSVNKCVNEFFTIEE